MSTKKTRSMRLDEAQLNRINEMGVNVSELVRELLDQWLKIKVCPVCSKEVALKSIDKKK